MQVLFQILGVIVLLAAIAPVAMAGGQMIAAFMVSRRIAFWCGITLLTMLLLVGSGLVAMRVVMPALAGSELLAPLVSSVVMLAPPWAAWLLGKRWAEKKDAT